ncbi:hypothetical protein K469DRAFT_718246 [Zopfia rhizophila CBS 207.26]|uniref:Uncharacterized protein n=1 Tax=Zopfia rhizophila CBS 207.26 TaxID=1314779 RepID=A0A6A6DG29_9PEZI|nr:hypothetical protein K469DRAFT_718246 [Zopfia rhizophila CBS 207.26]
MEIAKQEEAKQVRFELGRVEGRARERGEHYLPESERRRAEETEKMRRLHSKKQED